jgi:hypothetical protein
MQGGQYPKNADKGTFLSNFGSLSSAAQAYFSQFEPKTQINYAAKDTSSGIGRELEKRRA